MAARSQTQLSIQAQIAHNIINWNANQEESLKDNKSVKDLIAQSCMTLCDPMDYSPPGSFVHGILQARILEWVAIPPPGDFPS